MFLRFRKYRDESAPLDRDLTASVAPASVVRSGFDLGRLRHVALRDSSAMSATGGRRVHNDFTKKVLIHI